jgi:hypothetical protein
MRALLAGVLALVAAQPAQAFHYTHRVEISGSITDEWTKTDPASCGMNGDGSLKVTFKTRAATRVRPEISDTISRPRSNKPGAWVLFVPASPGITAMDTRKADATITTVDSTVPGPNTEFPGEPCFDEPEDRGCGTRKFPQALVEVAGFDERTLYGGFVGQFDDATECLGALESWGFPHKVAGGVNRFSDLLVKMPRPSKLRRKRVVVVQASDHKTSTSKVSENGSERLTDKVTRRLKVTFTRLG